MRNRFCVRSPARSIPPRSGITGGPGRWSPAGLFLGSQEKVNRIIRSAPGRTRTGNHRSRKPVRYPLRHGGWQPDGAPRVWTSRHAVVIDVVAARANTAIAYNGTLRLLMPGWAGTFPGDGRGSNPRPPGSQPGAPPIELPPPCRAGGQARPGPLSTHRLSTAT